MNRPKFEFNPVNIARILDEIGINSEDNQSPKESSPETISTYTKLLEYPPYLALKTHASKSKRLMREREQGKTERFKSRNLLAEYNKGRLI